jgi:hypothetical protein
MGWSISVPCASAKKQEAMLAYLEANYRPEYAVYGVQQTWRNQQVPTGPEGLKYGATPRKIGYNAPSEYERAVLRWIAYRVGMKRVFRGRLPGIPHAVPWLNCDNTSSEPVIPRALWDGDVVTEHYTVDEHGWSRIERWWEEIGDPPGNPPPVGVNVSEYDRRDAIIKAEIYRLDAGWEAQHAEQRSSDAGATSHRPEAR